MRLKTRRRRLPISIALHITSIYSTFPTIYPVQSFVRMLLIANSSEIANYFYGRERVRGKDIAWNKSQRFRF